MISLAFISKTVWKIWLHNYVSYPYWTQWVPMKQIWKAAHGIFSWVQLWQFLLSSWYRLTNACIKSKALQFPMLCTRSKQSSDLSWPKGYPTPWNILPGGMDRSWEELGRRGHLLLEDRTGMGQQVILCITGCSQV